MTVTLLPHTHPHTHIHYTYQTTPLTCFTLIPPCPTGNKDRSAKLNRWEPVGRWNRNDVPSNIPVENQAQRVNTPFENL